MIKIVKAVFSIVVFVTSVCGKDDRTEIQRRYFQRVSVFPICQQIGASCNNDVETGADDVAVSQDGKTLIYSDSLRRTAGFVNISDPVYPKPLGVSMLTGRPTSVAVVRNFALVAVDESLNFLNTAGSLKVISMATRGVVTSIHLGGQPNSVAVSPDGQYAVVCIKNERDPTAADGTLPQPPAGFVVALNLVGPPSSWNPRKIELTGLNNLRFPGDPEPESVTISEQNVAAITLQENNAIVLINLMSNSVVRTIDAGFVILNNVDLTEEKVVIQSETQLNALREPDGIVWINRRYFATADEGNLDGGSRGFTVYDSLDGSIQYSSRSSMEHLVASVGHYPESRSGERGNEPENLAFGFYNGIPYLFVSSERSSVVFVYDVTKPKSPVFEQVLPAGVGPEGIITIENRNLLVVASQVDSREKKIRSVITIYRYGSKNQRYPSIVSNNRGSGTPIPWSALSGLAAEIRPQFLPTAKKSRKPKRGRSGKGSSSISIQATILYAVEDSYNRKSRIFTIDASESPAKLIREVRVTDSFDLLKFAPRGLELINGEDDTVNLDLEGVAISKTGGLWVCSEGSGTAGDASDPVKSLNYLIKVRLDGKIVAVANLPDTINALQRSSGFQGCAEGSDGFTDTIVVVFQRAWGNEANPRLGAYNRLTRNWSFYYYPVDPVASRAGGWVGLGDIAPLGRGGEFLILERDNQGGPDAVIKRVYKINLGMHSPGDTVTKTLVRNIVPDIRAEGGLILEKVEGLTVDSTGDVWIVNDNDGVEDNNGETLLLNVMSSQYKAVF